MSSFKIGFKRSLRSADIYLCVLAIKVTESKVWPITFLRLGGLFSSAISRTADIAKMNRF